LGLEVHIVCAARIEGVGLAQATYVFDPSTFVQDERSKQMRYCLAVDSDVSIERAELKPSNTAGPS
jgi:hypothetical protein